MEVSTSSGQSNQNVTESVHQEILKALTADSSRLSSMEQRIEKADEQLQGRSFTQVPTTFSVSGASMLASIKEASEPDDEAIIPSA